MKWAGIFPGQGSQQTGMGKFLFDEFKVAREVFEEASDALSMNLKKLCFEGPESDLASTENTQPALLTVSTATLKSIQELMPVELSYWAGHSIGEYAAVVASGSLNFSDAVRAVRQRGQAMQKAVPQGEGGMVAALGLTDEQAQFLCRWAMETSQLGVLEPANYNSPGQIVLSGHQSVIDWLKDNLDKSIFDPAPTRLKLIPLNVSAPFHCSLMKPAEEKMQEVLSAMKFKQALQPVIQNVSAEAITDADLIRQNLVSQVSAPVKWTDCVLQLKKREVTHLIELGCGRVLSGLVKKIDAENLQTFGVNSVEDIKALETLIKGA